MDRFPLLRPFIFAALILLVLIAGNSARAQIASQPAVRSTPAVAAPPVGGAPAPATQPDDDFAPGLAIFALLVLLALLAIAALAVIVFVVAGGGVLILIFMGILSLSLLYGLLRRSVGEGARALTIQLAAVCGMPAGVLLLFFIIHFTPWEIHFGIVVAVGLVMGASAGGAIGYLFTRAMLLLYQAITRRRVPTAPVPGHFPIGP